MSEVSGIIERRDRITNCFTFVSCYIFQKFVVGSLVPMIYVCLLLNKPP
jgi:hypothetical protein